jgi:GNAT superfamily N-acetyltransferase
VQIRPARHDEIDQLIAAYEWLFAPPGSRPPMWDEPAARSRLAAVIDSDRAEVLVADVDDRVAGFVTVYDDMDSVRFGRRAWVEDLAVDPDSRSQGLGKALLDEAKDWARGKGASHLELDSSEARPDAHRFYDREEPTWRSICFGWVL